MYEANTWALVLAAGDGTRLRSLTTGPSGAAVPKQFCSLYEGPSLLHEAIDRAGAVSEIVNTCAVVAGQHRRWWEGSVDVLPANNVIVQPQNRGTANGILLPLLHLVERDPGARLVLLPSDHHVLHEAILRSSLRNAVEQLQWRPEDLLLLGLEPEEADPELGYILPGRSDGRGALTVERFIEKPQPAAARELIEGGALWNAFIVVANAQALLSLFRRRMAEIVTEMRTAVQQDLQAGSDGTAVTRLYEKLPTLDFSRDVLEGQETVLRTLRVPRCGWSDLGTPKRVAEALRRAPLPQPTNWLRGALGHLSLAIQHEKLVARTMLEHSA